MFTLIFDGDIHDYPTNPFLTDTPFGRPKIVDAGNLADERDKLQAEVERLRNDCRPSDVAWSDVIALSPSRDGEK